MSSSSGGVTIAVLDLQREAADNAELQMDGGDGGRLRSALCAKGPRQPSARKGSFPPGYTAASCSSPRSTEEGGGDGDRRQSSLSASSTPITVKASDFACADLELI